MMTMPSPLLNKNFFYFKRFLRFMSNSFPSNIPLSCLECDVNCTNEIDANILDSIDRTSPLIGTVKPYAHQLCLGIPSPWPSKIHEIQNSFVQLVLKESKTLPQKVITSATDGLPTDALYMFPERLQFDPLQEQTETSIHQFIHEKKFSLKLKEKAHILVCIHQSMDVRCGAIGPLLIDAFKKEISQLGQDIKVFGVSHVGGHKFAGNVIIYHENPLMNGHWYGRVEPRHVPQLLRDHVMNGCIVQELWRGCHASIYA